MKMSPALKSGATFPAPYLEAIGLSVYQSAAPCPEKKWRVGKNSLPRMPQCGHGLPPSTLPRSERQLRRIRMPAHASTENRARGLRDDRGCLIATTSPKIGENRLHIFLHWDCVGRASARSGQHCGIQPMIVS